MPKLPPHVLQVKRPEQMQRRASTLSAPGGANACAAQVDQSLSSLSPRPKSLRDDAL